VVLHEDDNLASQSSDREPIAHASFFVIDPSDTRVEVLTHDPLPS